MLKGVINAGSPFSTLQENAPQFDLTEIKEASCLLLGVCYGAQYMALTGGGEVAPSKIEEYGRANLSEWVRTFFFEVIPVGSQVWMSHGDTITSLPAGFEVIASTEDVRVAGYAVQGEQTYGIQFNPEVYRSTDGKQLLENFLYKVVGVSR